MINKLRYSILAIIICSCNSTQNAFYKTNKNKLFSSKEQIVNYYSSNNKLDKRKLYFFRDEAAKIDFLINSTDTDALPYFGLFVNDSTKIAEDLTIDKSCIGVIDKFIRGNYNSSKTESFNLKKYQLTNYLNEPININKDNTTLIFVVNSNMGKIINHTATYLTDNTKKSKIAIDYIYLVSDPILK